MIVGGGGGFGLLGMRERLAALGGSLELFNNGGAHVVAVVPRESMQTPEMSSQNDVLDSDF